MACTAEQEEEAEVLQSIYEGDSNFRQISATKYHYRYGEENSLKDFVVEIVWGENYPNEIPEINLDLFGNNHILQEIRDSIKSALLEQADGNTGMPMTFTLFEWVKENAESFMVAQPEKGTQDVKDDISPTREDPKQTVVVKKEKLTKSQKRKLAGRSVHGELPRGHDWIDVIKHLCQSGGVAA